MDTHLQRVTGFHSASVTVIVARLDALDAPCGSSSQTAAAIKAAYSHKQADKNGRMQEMWRNPDQEIIDEVTRIRAASRPVDRSQWIACNVCTYPVDPAATEDRFGNPRTSHPMCDPRGW